MFSCSKCLIAPLVVVHTNRKRWWGTNKQLLVFRGETLTSNSSLDSARGNESIIYFTKPCKPIEIYIYASKKHPFASDPAAKHPNAANLGVTGIRQNQRSWFCCATRASNFAFAILLSTQVPLQKFQFLSRYTIPCAKSYTRKSFQSRSHLQKTTPNIYSNNSSVDVFGHNKLFVWCIVNYQFSKS